MALYDSARSFRTETMGASALAIAAAAVKRRRSMASPKLLLRPRGDEDWDLDDKDMPGDHDEAPPSPPPRRDLASLGADAPSPPAAGAGLPGRGPAAVSRVPSDEPPTPETTQPGASRAAAERDVRGDSAGDGGAQAAPASAVRRSTPSLAAIGSSSVPRVPRTAASAAAQGKRSAFGPRGSLELLGSRSLPRSGCAAAPAVRVTHPPSLPKAAQANPAVVAAGGVASGPACFSSGNGLERAATASCRGRVSIESEGSVRARKRRREHAALSSDDENESDALSVVSAHRRARSSVGSAHLDTSHEVDAHTAGRAAAAGSHPALVEESSARRSDAARVAAPGVTATAATAPAVAAAAAADGLAPAGQSAGEVSAYARTRGEGSARRAPDPPTVVGLRLPGCRAADWTPANGSAVVVAGSVRLTLQEAVAGSRIITGAGPAGEDGGDRGARRAVKLDVPAWWPLADGDRAWLIGGALPPGPPGRKACPRGMVRARGADGAQRSLRSILERCQRQDQEGPAGGAMGAAASPGRALASGGRVRSAPSTRRRDDDSSDDDDDNGDEGAGRGDGADDIDVDVDAPSDKGVGSGAHGPIRPGASASNGSSSSSSAALPRRTASVPLLQRVATSSDGSAGALAGWLPRPAQPLTALVLPVSSLARLLQRARLRPRSLSARHPAIPCAIEVAGVTAVPANAAGMGGVHLSMASWPLVGSVGGGPGGGVAKANPWDEPRAISSREAAAATTVASAGTGSPGKRHAGCDGAEAGQSMPCPAPATTRLAGRLGFQESTSSAGWVARGHLWRFTLEGWALSSKGGGLALFAQRSAPPASLVLARRQLAALAGEDA